MEGIPGLGFIFSSSSSSQPTPATPQESLSAFIDDIEKERASRPVGRRERARQQRFAAKASAARYDMIVKYFLYTALGLAAAWFVADYFRATLRRWFGINIPRLPGRRSDDMYNLGSRKKSKFASRGKSSSVSISSRPQSITRLYSPCTVHELKLDGGFRPSGFTNLGNTCFMNSAMQALAAVPAFEQYLRVLLVSSPGNYNVEETLRLISTPRPDVSHFHRTICRSLKAFADFDQHDAQEFTLCLLSLLDTVRRESVELLSNAIRVQQASLSYITTPSSSLTSPHAPAITIMREGLGVLQERFSALEKDPFLSLEWHSRRCSKCHLSRSNSLVETRVMTLPIGDRPTTLEDCIDQYCATDTMNEVRCDYCTALATLLAVLKEIDSNLTAMGLPTLQQRLSYLGDRRLQQRRTGIIHHTTDTDSAHRRDQALSASSHADDRTLYYLSLRALGVPVSPTNSREENEQITRQYCGDPSQLSRQLSSSPSTLSSLSFGFDHVSNSSFGSSFTQLTVFESEAELGSPIAKRQNQPPSASTLLHFEKLIAQAGQLQNTLRKMQEQDSDIIPTGSPLTNSNISIAATALLSGGERVRIVSPAIWSDVNRLPLIDGVVITGAQGPPVAEITSKSTCTKHIALARCAPVLVLHLNRLMGDRKLQTKVQFPVVLDLSKQSETFLRYISRVGTVEKENNFETTVTTGLKTMSGNKTGLGLKKRMKNGNKVVNVNVPATFHGEAREEHDEEVDLNENNNEINHDDEESSLVPEGLLYDLVGVVVHLGSAYGGHYIAYRRHCRQIGWEQQGRGREMKHSQSFGSSGGVGMGFSQDIVESDDENSQDGENQNASKGLTKEANHDADMSDDSAQKNPGEPRTFPRIPREIVWSRISDSSVQEVPLSEVLRDTPYMLLYQKR